MTFRIILTVMFLTEALLTFDAIGKSRKPMTNGLALVSALVYGILVYGFWNWL